MSWTELWTAARDAAWPGSRSWRLRTTAKLLDSAEPAVTNEEQRLTSPRALFEASSTLVNSAARTLHDARSAVTEVTERCSVAQCVHAERQPGH
jgi:hypothetical protein